MKSVITLLIVGAALLAGCETDNFHPCIKGSRGRSVETRVLAPFKDVDFCFEDDLEIRYAGEPRLVIEGYENQLAYVNTAIEGKNLVIDSKRCLKNTRFRFVLYAPQLERIRLSGSGNIVINDDLGAGRTEYVLSGSGSIRSVCKHVQEVVTRVSGSGKIYLSGACNVLKSEISGSGKLHAYDLTATYLHGQISGSGTIESRVINRIDASISGSGRVNYKGNPAVSAVISGSGKVVNAN